MGKMTVEVLDRGAETPRCPRLSEAHEGAELDPRGDGVVATGFTSDGPKLSQVARILDILGLERVSLLLHSSLLMASINSKAPYHVKLVHQDSPLPDTTVDALGAFSLVDAASEMSNEK